MNPIEQLFASRTPQSRALHERALQYLPAGTTRSVANFAPYPVSIDRGEGARLYDVDGNGYFDVLNNYTSLVHGNAHPALSEQINAQVTQGTVFPAPHAAQTELAERLCERYPAVERVRFTNSGSEAATLAVRLAQYTTGRSGVLRFRGGYHGTGTELADVTANTVFADYNDIASIEAAANGEIACIIVEPFMGSGGVVVGTREFLEACQTVARRTGAIFILDEVQALRNHFSGMHDLLGLTPDLVLMGKVIGGGLPIGAVGGKDGLMQLLDSMHAGSIAHSGTFNGLLPTMRAGVVALQMLDESAIETLNARTAALAESIERSASAHGLHCAVSRSGSIAHVHFSDHVPTLHSDVQDDDPVRRKLFHLALLNEGVYAAPRGMFNLSTALSEEDLEEIGARFARAFAAVARVLAEGEDQ